MAQSFIKKAATSAFNQLESKKDAIKKYCREKHISLKVEQKKLTNEFLLELIKTKEVHSIIGFNHSGHTVYQGKEISKKTFQETDINQLLVVIEVKELSTHFIQLLQVKLPELVATQSKDSIQSPCKENKGFLPLSSSKVLSTYEPLYTDEQSELEKDCATYIYEEQSNPIFAQT